MENASNKLNLLVSSLGTPEEPAPGSQPHWRTTQTLSSQSSFCSDAGNRFLSSESNIADLSEAHMGLFGVLPKLAHTESRIPSIELMLEVPYLRATIITQNDASCLREFEAILRMKDEALKLRELVRFGAVFRERFLCGNDVADPAALRELAALLTLYLRQKLTKFVELKRAVSSASDAPPSGCSRSYSNLSALPRSNSLLANEPPLSRCTSYSSFVKSAGNVPQVSLMLWGFVSAGLRVLCAVYQSDVLPAAEFSSELAALLAAQLDSAVVARNMLFSGEFTEDVAHEVRSALPKNLLRYFGLVLVQSRRGAALPSLDWLACCDFLLQLSAAHRLDEYLRFLTDVLALPRASFDVASHGALYASSERLPVAESRQPKPSLELQPNCEPSSGFAQLVNDTLFLYCDRCAKLAAAPQDAALQRLVARALCFTDGEVVEPLLFEDAATVSVESQFAEKFALLLRMFDALLSAPAADIAADSEEARERAAAQSALREAFARKHLVRKLAALATEALHCLNACSCAEEAAGLSVSPPGRESSAPLRVATIAEPTLALLTQLCADRSQPFATEDDLMLLQLCAGYLRHTAPAAAAASEQPLRAVAQLLRPRTTLMLIAALLERAPELAEGLPPRFAETVLAFKKVLAADPGCELAAALVFGLLARRGAPASFGSSS